MSSLYVVLFLLALSFYSVSADRLSHYGRGAWYSFGKDLYNSRSVMDGESNIYALNVANLVVSFNVSLPAFSNPAHTSPDFSSAGPSITPDLKATFTDRAGNVFQYDVSDPSNTTPVWQFNIGSYMPSTSVINPAFYPDFHSFSRNTPLYIPRVGRRPPMQCFGNYHSGDIMCVDHATGAPRFITRVENNTEAAITTSLTYLPEYDRIYFGVSSNEELTNALVPLLYPTLQSYGIPAPSYYTMSFRGSFGAIDASTGNLVGKTILCADPNSIGCSAWGSAIGCERIQCSHDGPNCKNGVQYRCYLATGNNYRISAAWSACQAAANNQCGNNVLCRHDATAACAAQYDTDLNRFDAMVQFDALTLDILGTIKTDAYDPYNVMCLFTSSPFFCDAPPNDDFDFGGAGVLVDYQQKRLYFNAAKSGWGYWVSRDTWTVAGNPIHFCSGSGNGGNMWGLACNSKAGVCYVPCTGLGGPYVLANNQTTSFGSVSAINTDGVIIAQFVHPIISGVAAQYHAFWAPPTLVNDVLIIGSATGYLFFLRANDLTEIRRIYLGFSIWAGVSVVGDTICVADGYSYGSFALTHGQSQLYCYSLSSICERDW